MNKTKLINIFSFFVVMFITLNLIKKIHLLNDHIIIKLELIQTCLSNVMLNDLLQYIMKQCDLTNINKSLLVTLFILISLVWLLLILKLIFGNIFDLLLWLLIIIIMSAYCYIWLYYLNNDIHDERIIYENKFLGLQIFEIMSLEARQDLVNWMVNDVLDQLEPAFWYKPVCNEILIQSILDLKTVTEMKYVLFEILEESYHQQLSERQAAVAEYKSKQHNWVIYIINFINRLF